MGEPVLLFIRISLPGFHHPCNLSVPDLDRDGVLPAVW